MSLLSLSQTLTAVGPNITSSFLGVGGTMPYSYSVLSGGAGGTINGSTGKYIAPAAVPPDPSMIYDTIQVTDSLGNIATADILIGTPLLLFCDIIQTQMGLATGRVYLWDQKIFQPSDNGLYVAVSVLQCKPFGNNNVLDSSGNSVQTVNMNANLQVDIISRGPEARDRKEEIIMALNSNYAQSQQEANSFYIGKLPPGGQFLNLSNVDGAAIPYRYNITVALQYFVTKTVPVPYFNTFTNPPTVTTEP